MIDIDKLQNSILKTIQDEDGEALEADNYRQTLEDKFLQPHLEYVKEKSNKIAGSEILGKENDPEVPLIDVGQEFSYIEFQFAIEGNYMYKDVVFDSVWLEANNLYFDTIDTNVYLVYKAQSSLATENDSTNFLELANAAGARRRAFIEERIALFNKEVDEVNVVLKAFIQQNLAAAKQERGAKKAVLDALDPF